MATSVCQKLHSRFEPWLIEPLGIGFEFSLSSRHKSNSHLKNNIHHQTLHNLKPEKPKESTKKEGFGGWTFLQALSNVSSPASQENNKVYVHPMAKRSSSVLSEKSLAMCTESLGSETGSNMSENGNDLITCLVPESERSKKMPCFGERKRWSSFGDGGRFPPPLTTISGGSSGGQVRVESKREEGRLVLKAVSIEAQKRCFMAERSDGRLKLHLVSSTSGSSFPENDDECNYYDDDDHDQVNDYDDHDYEEINDDDVYDDNEEEDGNEGIEENSENNEGEIEVGNFRRPRRCYGRRSKKALNWEALWVATS